MYRLARADSASREATRASRHRGQPWGEKPAGLRYVSLDAALAEEMTARGRVH